MKFDNKSWNWLDAMLEDNYIGLVDEMNKKAYLEQYSIGSPQSYLSALKRLGDAPYNYKKPKLYAAPTGNDQKSGGYFIIGAMDDAER